MSIVVTNSVVIAAVVSLAVVASIALFLGRGFRFLATLESIEIKTEHADRRCECKSGDFPPDDPLMSVVDRAALATRDLHAEERTKGDARAL
jgi:hypothetical protein